MQKPDSQMPMHKDLSQGRLEYDLCYRALLGCQSTASDNTPTLRIKPHMEDTRLLDYCSAQTVVLFDLRVRSSQGAFHASNSI